MGRHFYFSDRDLIKIISRHGGKRTAVRNPRVEQNRPAAFHSDGFVARTKVCQCDEYFLQVAFVQVADLHTLGYSFKPAAGTG